MENYWILGTFMFRQTMTNPYASKMSMSSWPMGQTCLTLGKLKQRCPHKLPLYTRPTYIVTIKLRPLHQYNFSQDTALQESGSPTCNPRRESRTAGTKTELTEHCEWKH